MSVDSHNRQRGNDEADASLLVEDDDPAKDVEVVIGAVESNQANHRAAHDLKPTLAIETKRPTAALLGFWRNSNVLTGAKTACTGTSARADCSRDAARRRRIVPWPSDRAGRGLAGLKRSKRTSAGSHLGRTGAYLAALTGMLGLSGLTSTL